MWDLVRRRLYSARLTDPAYRFLFEPAPSDEVVVLDCETTGLDPHRDEIVAVAAIIVRGNRILTSQSFLATVRTDRKSSPQAIKVHHLLESDTQAGVSLDVMLPQLLHFIGGRPIVGYYTDFDLRMLGKYTRRMIRIRLPNRRIDVSELYYASKYKSAPDYVKIDLSFSAMLTDLEIPALPQHNAFNDAVMTAMMYVQLRDMRARHVSIRRELSGIEGIAFGA